MDHSCGPPRGRGSDVRLQSACRSPSRRARSASPGARAAAASRRPRSSRRTRRRSTQPSSVPQPVLPLHVLDGPGAEDTRVVGVALDAHLRHVIGRRLLLAHLWQSSLSASPAALVSLVIFDHRRGGGYEPCETRPVRNPQGALHRCLVDRPDDGRAGLCWLPGAGGGGGHGPWRAVASYSPTVTLRPNKRAWCQKTATRGSSGVTAPTWAPRPSIDAHKARRRARTAPELDDGPWHEHA